MTNTVRDVFALIKESREPVKAKILRRRRARLDDDGTYKPGASGHRVDMEMTIFHLFESGYLRLNEEIELEAAARAFMDAVEEDVATDEEMYLLEDRIGVALHELDEARKNLDEDAI